MPYDSNSFFDADAEYAEVNKRIEDLKFKIYKARQVSAEAGKACADKHDKIWRELMDRAHIIAPVLTNPLYWMREEKYPEYKTAPAKKASEYLAKYEPLLVAEVATGAA